MLAESSPKSLETEDGKDLNEILSPGSHWSLHERESCVSVAGGVIPSARLGSKLPFNKTCPNRNHILVLRAIERLDVGFVLFIAICGVCVGDGWFEQPHLARVRLIGLWGWVRLHT